MNAELIALSALAAPAAILGPVCLAGHLWASRQDAAAAAAFRSAPAEQPPPGGPGEPLPAPEALAEVIALPVAGPGDTEQAQSA
ncbi:hypothetical protein [Streptomyces sp. JJ36]|uniref:hypothetical protein n=1 Tax=Streptomyces sp. JJ36 TaxID=2736645 RepID=UPI001F3DE82E|nr:hypothetical protein [Streptomyces sp. JJ36]MCF6525667.1 hypothetical protein [Streptomyces sp. JJ36]